MDLFTFVGGPLGHREQFEMALPSLRPPYLVYIPVLSIPPDATFRSVDASTLLWTRDATASTASLQPPRQADVWTRTPFLGLTFYVYSGRRPLHVRA